MEWEQFSLGVLLHDLGKVLERSKKYELPEDLTSAGQYSHPRYSALLIRVLKSEVIKNDYFTSNLNDKVESLVLNHHNPKTTEDLILQVADWLSASEREKDDDTRESYNTIPLVSIFSRVGDNKEEFYYKLKKLSYDTLMPLKKEEFVVDSSTYRTLIDEFLNKIRYVDNIEKLLSLIEIYFSSTPAQTTGYISDISIFDHSRTTLAIAGSLYLDYSSGILNKEKLKKIRDWIKDRKGDLGKEKIFIILEGDLSGIQNFIFSIPSKKAARSLKGRSVYLSLLSRYSANYIIRETGLTSANILYIGGGNFQILLPISAKEKLETIRRYISSLIWQIHRGDIALNIDWYETSLEEVLSFEDVKTKLREKLSLKKLQRFKEIEYMYENIFLPEDEVVYEGENCVVCGKKSRYQYEDQRLCPVCNSLVELTDSLKDARYLLEYKCKENNKKEDIFDLFRALGYEIRFSKEITPADKIFVLNDFELLRDGRLLDGFLLGSFNLPDKEFEEIGEASSTELEDGTKLGDDKLAYLKMDVDNLGRILSKLSEKEKNRGGMSLSRIRSLSNRLDLFFSGYLIDYISKYDAENKYLYPVFVGGDDLYIIGSWNRVVELAEKIREDFRKYTANNPLFTISAGIAFFRSDYPVIRAGREVEEELERAKRFTYAEENIPSKDKVSLIKEVLNWKEFTIGLRLRSQITKATKDKEPRAVIFKIERAIKGFKPILEESISGRIKVPPIWRLSYYLRDYKDIAEILEDIIIDNLFEKEKIRNPMIIAVASKLSEMDTRKIESGGR